MRSSLIPTISEDFNPNEHTCLLKFSADWCGPCKAVTPTLEKIVGDTGVEIFEVDIDARPELAEQFGIRSIPTVIAFKDGSPIDMLVGAHPEEKYETLASQVLG